MESTADEVRQRALDLPEAARAELAYELLESLPEAPVSLARTDEEWIAEIERRARAAIAGAPGLAWAAVRAHIETRIGRR
jgi:hypothetical protein